MNACVHAESTGRGRGNVGYDASAIERQLVRGVLLIIVCCVCSRASAVTYDVVRVGDEWRCRADGFHFLTIIEYVADINTPGLIHHVFFVRSHPGTDINGWGTTWQAMPFLPGATLDHVTSLSVAAAEAGVEVSVAGNVSRGSSGTYGTWGADLAFEYVAPAKRVDGTGTYSIALAGLLAGLGDLNLYLVSSNYLRNVPLQTCTIGNTGDMANLDSTYADGHHFVWTPNNGDSCPSEGTSSLDVQISGALNLVNTYAQGHSFQIAAAYKPMVQVGLTIIQPSETMSLCAFYAESESQNFAADNVGINALRDRA